MWSQVRRGKRLVLGAYDASGRRVLKTPTSGNPTYYFYTQDGQLLYQFEANSTKSTDYIFLGKKLIAYNEGCNTAVTGNIDSVNIDGSGNATVSGCACSTGIAASITVEVLAGGPSGGGGTRVATATANQPSEPAVATACQTSGTTYRFNIPLTTAIRSQYVDTLITGILAETFQRSIAGRQQPISSCFW